MKIKDVHMLDKTIGSADVLEASKTNLCDDGTEFAAGRRDTVCGGTVTSGEGFTRNDLEEPMAVRK